MNREIWFRGKRIDNGEWVVGSLVKMGPAGYFHYFILPDYASVFCDIEVDPGTIGQYIGLTDKNGVKIFEGDIIHAVTPNTSKNCCVKFEFGQFCVGINMPLAYVLHSCEVIGNIHDNPELLGGDDGTDD